VRGGADCTVLAGKNRRLAPPAARRFERTQAQLAGRDMAALHLVGIEGLFTPGLLAQLAGVQAGARHAAQAGEQKVQVIDERALTTTQLINS